MKNTVTNETTLKRVPSFIILAILLLLSSVIAVNSFKHANKPPILQPFIPLILQWSGILISVITAFLAFTQYRLVKDKIALLIGLTTFFSGVIEACPTLFMSSLSLHLDTNVWLFTNFLSNLTLAIGLLFVLNKLRSSQKQLEYHASHDALTNLYNRREFENVLDRIITSYAEKKHSFALFLIDIDNFKNINDTLGHSHGDDFLKKFAKKLSNLIRQGDIVARIGGDEFTVIIPHLNSPDVALKLANRILNNLNIPYQVGEKTFTNTVSIGIAIYPDNGLSAEKLLKNADIAMYNSKKAGKNTYSFV
jgi:diguanylate cyclase (GGDEF)-like protein